MNPLERPRRSRHGHRGLVALAVLLAVVGCGSPANSVAPATASPTVSVTASPTTAPSPAASPPIGATGTIDAQSADLAARLRAPDYSTDTTAAAIEILARSGVETFATPGAAAPIRAADGVASPLRLLDFQAHALAVGAWAGGGLTGAELDDLLPVTSADEGLPQISAVLAGYVAAADTPGAAVARALLGGEDLLDPQSIQFPTLVLVLFASEVATDGTTASVPSRVTLALAAVPAPGAGVVAAISGTLCSDASRFIDSAIHDLFAALKVATPGNAVGRIIVSIWNWIVDQGERFVHTLIRAVTDAVLSTVRVIAGSVAAIAEQVASFLPYAVNVRTLQDTAQGESSSTTFFLLPDQQLGGQFVATITAGDLPAWPDLLADCAATAQVALPNFREGGLPVIWRPFRGSAGQFVGGILADGATNAQGEARWTFITSLDPGSPDAEQINVIDQMPVVVHRQEVQAARDRLDRLAAALLAPIPELLRGFVGRLFAPFVDALQSQLNGLLDARGLGHITIVYHGGTRPTPAPATASPAPTPVPTAGSPGLLPVACALVSAAEVAAIIGHPVTARENPDAIINPATQSNCYYGGEDGGGIFQLLANAPGSLEAIISQRAVTPLPGLGDRAYTWSLSSLRYAAAQIGDIVLMVVGRDAAAVAQVLRVAVAHL